MGGIMQNPLRQVVLVGLLISIFGAPPVHGADAVAGTPRRGFTLPEWLNKPAKSSEADPNANAFLKNPKPLTAKDVLADLVKDKALGQLFRISQMNHIRTEIDYDMWRLLRHNPLFMGMEKELDNLINSVIDDGIMSGNLK